MANTSSRTLRLLSLLQTHRHWSGPELADRLGVSERTIREWIHRPLNPLPAVRVGGKILVRRSVFDQWLESHRLIPVDVGCIVEELVAGGTRN